METNAASRFSLVAPSAQTAAHDAGNIADSSGTQPVVRWALLRRCAPALAAVGRFGAVSLPVTSVHAIYSTSVDSAFLTSVGLTTSVWFVALRRAYAATRPSTFALGAPLTSALGTILGLAAIALILFWLPGTQIARQELILMSGGVFLGSAAFELILARYCAFRRRVIVVGASACRARLVEDLRQPKSQFVCIGVVDEQGEQNVADGLPLLGRLTDLPEIVDREHPELVVLAGTDPQSAAVDGLLDSPWSGFRVVDVRQFYEHAYGLVPIEELAPVWFMGVLHLYHRPSSQWSKRLFDLTVAAAGLVLSAALFLILAWLVRRSGPGPVLLRQVRLGKDGRMFEMLKFRTMLDGAERPGTALLTEVDDPRITPVGRVLRKTRLDELPQLWNVLKGEMSVVGPRPERPEFLETLQREIPFWTRRHLVRPGITGWAQVRGGYASDAGGMVTKLSHDFYYLKHRSLLLDLAILVKTMKIVLSGSGAR